MKLSGLSKLPLPLLFAIFFCLLLPLLWFFIFWNLNRLHDETYSNSRIHTENLVRAFAEEVRSSVNSIDFALVEAREEWLREPKSFANTVRNLQTHLEEDVGFQIAVIDATGMLVFSSTASNNKKIDLSDRDHFKIHRERPDDRLFISKPVFGRVSQRWTIQFTRPIREVNGQFAGVIVLSVAPEYFSRFYNTINLGKDGSIALTRTSGEILARSPKSDLGLGKSIEDAPFLKGKTASNGVYEKHSEVDGVRRLYGWRILPKGDLAVWVGNSLSTVFEPYYQQRRTYIFGGVVVSLLLGIFAFFLLFGLKKLQAEQRRMQVILESSHDAFVAVDSKGRITDWNAKAEKTFGWSAGEVIGKELASVIIPEEKRDAHNSGYQKFAMSGKSKLVNRVLELEAVHRSGTHVPVELALAGFHDGKGYAANAFVRDVSERKEAERLNAEHTRILEDTRKALQQSQKLEALGRLTGGIAHDFNNVLQTLSTGIQLLLFSSQDQKHISTLETCERAVERGVGLTRQLSVFGRVQEAHLETVDLHTRTKEMIPLLQRALPSHIELKVNLMDSLWPVEIDPHQFELALLNLTINARDAMPNGGRFVIEGKNETLALQFADLAPGDYVHLVIADTGKGMSPEVLGKALDPFFTTKPVGKGSGLGLPQVYGFAKQMGGTLILHSLEGEGVQISMYLPRAIGKVVSSGIQASTRKEISKSEGTILCVEDDPLVRQTIQPALEAAGFTIVMAQDGEDAVRLLETGQKIDLVFSDIVMPGHVSGIDLANIVESRFPKIRIVLATGYSERDIDLPHIRILAKPYELSTLVSYLNEELLTRPEDV